MLSLILGVGRPKIKLPNLLSCYSNSSFNAASYPVLSMPRMDRSPFHLGDCAPHQTINPMNPVSSTSQLRTLVHTFGSSNSCLEGATFVSSGRVKEQTQRSLREWHWLTRKRNTVWTGVSGDSLHAMTISVSDQETSHTVQTYMSNCTQLYWPQLCHSVSDKQQNDPTPKVPKSLRYCSWCSLVHTCFFHCFFKLQKKSSLSSN